MSESRLTRSDGSLNSRCTCAARDLECGQPTHTEPGEEGLGQNQGFDSQQCTPPLGGIWMAASGQRLATNTHHRRCPWPRCPIVAKSSVDRDSMIEQALTAYSGNFCSPRMASRASAGAAAVPG